jgi:hypothetical protein
MGVRLTFFVLGVCTFSSLVLRAQTSGSPDEARSQTTSIEPQSEISGNVNPTRILKSHTQSGNRTLDIQSVQLRGSDGNFERYQDIEKETVKVNATTARTTTRTFGRNSDGAKTLVQVTEEEKRTSPGGDSSIVRSTSNPDANGRLQVVQRELWETRKLSKDVEETKTTVMLPGGNGDLAAAMKTQERRQQGGNNTMESQKTTFLPDGNGGWQVGEVRRATIQQNGKTRTAEESVSRSDLDGNLSAISRTIGTDSESAPGEESKTVETYSIDVPGTTRDGNLHPVQRVTISQRANSTGRQTTEQQVEQPDPGNPGAGLRVTTVTIDTVSPSSSGANAKRTIQALDANGNLGIVSVDTTDRRGGAAVQVQIAPSEKPK